MSMAQDTFAVAVREIDKQLAMPLMRQDDALRIALALCERPQRFTELSMILRHPEKLMRAARKLIAAGYAEKDNLGAYRITVLGRSYARAAEPLARWIDERRRQLND